MIDIDRLERIKAVSVIEIQDAEEGDGYTHAVLLHPETVAALIRAVRAAMEYEVWSDAVSISQAFDARDELEAALAPFRGSEDA